MMSRTGIRQAFTLVEVMIASCVLAIGSIGVYQSFFIALDASGYNRHYLDAACLADNLLWQTSSNLALSGERGGGDPEGDSLVGERTHHWQVSSFLQEEVQDACQLFRINASVSWKEGRKKARISRSGFALYREEK